MRTTFDAARARSGPGSLALLGESWAILRAQPAPVLGGLLLANVAFAGAAQGASAWAAEALKAPPAHWAFEVAKAAVMALITAISLRLFLAPQSRWARLDRSLARGVMLLTLAGLAVTAAGALGRALHPSPFELLNELEFQIPVWGFCATLMLWPAGVLIEDAEMSSARSMALMRGRVGPYVVANLLQLGLMVLASVALVAVPALALQVNPKDFGKVLQLPFSLVFGAFAIAQAALWAALYRARTAAA